jgi:hypothetical protein
MGISWSAPFSKARFLPSSSQPPAARDQGDQNKGDGHPRKSRLISRNTHRQECNAKDQENTRIAFEGSFCHPAIIHNGSTVFNGKLFSTTKDTKVTKENGS